MFLKKIQLFLYNQALILNKVRAHSRVIISRSV